MKQNIKIFSSWGPKIFAFLLAVTVVLLVEFSNITNRVVTIPLNVTLPENLSAESLVPETVEIVISGSEDLIYLVDPARVSAHADFSSVDRAGIARVPVVLDFNQDVFRESSISVKAQPSSVRILFSLEGQ